MPVPRRPRRLAVATLIVLAAACATPVGVREVDERTVRRTLTSNVLSAGEPSVPSRQVLLRLGLYERFKSDPEAALAQLHAHAIVELDPSQLFAAAEYSFLHASRTRDRGRFVAASVYAYAYLFPAEADALPDAFDPRVRTAVDLYNRSIAAALVSEQRKVAVREGSFPFPLGILELQIDSRGFEWADHRLTDFVPAAELEVRGLRNRYRRAGIGAPFVASPVSEPGRTVAIENARVLENAKVPVTFFLRYADPQTGLRTGEFRATLEVYSQDAASHIEVAGRKVPLEYETSSALAYGLERSKLWDFELAGYLRGDVLPVEDALFMLQPYVPGKIPVVLVHGTASSPARWAELLNELNSDPQIEARYQLWLFIYSTGNPVLYSASLLRESLAQIEAELDPEGRDLALQRMVLIGHSQGGLLCKLQVISSGDRFWSSVSDQPFDEVPMRPATRELIGKAVFFEAQPYIERVIFISTPQHGSYVAGNWLGRIASRLFTAPRELMSAGVDFAGAGVDALRRDQDARLRREMARIPSSVENMRPGHRFVVTLSSIPVDEAVKAHSIIPVTGGPPPEGQNDGVVEYESAHIDEAVSEYVVYESGHSTQSNPETIQEVRRILLEHLQAAE